MIGFTHLGLPRSSTPEVRLRFGFDNTPVSLCMLPSQPPQAVQQPAPAPPMALQPPPPRAAEPLMDDDDDKGKVSRWQIGSTSLSVLEQVYAMEPFPGAATLPGAAPARVGPREGCLGWALRRAPRAAVATARRTAACSDTPRVNATQSIPPCSLHFPRECRRPRDAARAVAEAERLGAPGPGLVPEQAPARTQALAGKGAPLYPWPARHSGSRGCAREASRGGNASRSHGHGRRSEHPRDDARSSRRNLPSLRCPRRPRRPRGAAGDGHRWGSCIVRPRGSARDEHESG